MVAVMVLSMMTPFALTGAQSSGIAVAQETDEPQFEDDFENESADSGVPDNWTEVTDPFGKGATRNVLVEEVTTNMSYRGDQAYYVEEDETANAAWMQPETQPYSDTVTEPVSFAMYKPSVNHDDNNAPDGPAIQIAEGTGSTSNKKIELRVQEDRLVYRNETGGSGSDLFETVADGVNADEWVHVTVFNINPTDDTCDLRWTTASDSGTVEDIPMLHSMSEGYDHTFLSVDDAGGLDTFAVGNMHTVSGQVVDQHGQPVADTVVEVWGVDYSTLDADDLSSRADELLNDAENPEPPAWNASLNLQSQFSDADATYPAVHAPEDWGVENTGWVESPDASDPMLQAPADESLVLSAWDPTAGSLTNDGINRDLPGQTTDGTVEVTRLDHVGDEIDTREVELNEDVSTGFGSGINPFSQDHNYATVTLEPGFYHIQVQGSEHPGYTIVVGDVDDLTSMIQSDLENKAGELSEQAQSARDKLTTEKFARTTVRTDSDGRFEAGLPANVERAAVQSYKADGTIFDTIRDPSLQRLRDAQEQGYNGSVTLSTTPTRTDVPNDNVTVTSRKLESPPFGNMTRYEDLLENFRDEVLNESIADLESDITQRLEDIQGENLQTLFGQLRDVIEGNSNLEDAYLEESGRDEIPDAESLSTDELREETDHMQTALHSISEIDMPDPEDPGFDGGDLSMTFPIGQSIASDDVAVLLHWSDGTTETMSGDYWSVQSSGILGGDEVVIDGFPIEEQADGRALADVQVRVANGNGHGSVRAPVENPAFDGNVPNVEGIDLSTMKPGSDERVSFELNAEDGTGFDSLTDVEVYGPGGDTLNASIDGERASFTTSGEGVHHVRATYQSQSGDEFVQSIRVRAGDSPSTPPSTVRATQGVGGPVAIAGDRLDNARIDVDDQSGDATISAVIPGDASAPSEVHLQTDTVMSGSADDVEFRLLRGSNEEAVRQHVSVTYHVEDGLGDNAIVWRGSGEPITYGGDTSFGEIGERNEGNKHVIHSYTDESGVLELSVNRDPGLIDRVRHRVIASSPIDLPLTAGIGTGPITADAVVEGVGDYITFDLPALDLPIPLTVQGVTA